MWHCYQAAAAARTRAVLVVESGRDEPGSGIRVQIYIEFCEEICGTGIPQKTDQEIIRMIISGFRVLGSQPTVWVMLGLMSAGQISV